MKIDCSKTENYIREKSRMVKICQKTDCSSCGYYNSKPCPRNFFEYGYEIQKPNEAINTVQKWSDEHPQKTYREDFFEKFPNAPKYENDYPYPMVNPKYIYGDIFENTAGITDCWDEVMEERVR